MPRDGDGHVGFQGRAAEDGHFCEHAGEQFTERVDIFKFQEEDGPDHGAIVERPAAHAVESPTAVIGTCATRTDEDAFIFSWGVFDGIAALVANGSED